MNIVISYLLLYWSQRKSSLFTKHGYNWVVDLFKKNLSKTFSRQAISMLLGMYKIIITFMNYKSTFISLIF